MVDIKFNAQQKATTTNTEFYIAAANYVKYLYGALIALRRTFVSRIKI